MLKTRILSALALGAVLLAVLLLLPPAWSAALITLAVLAGAWEWSAFTRAAPAARVAYVALIAALLAAAWYASRDEQALRTLLGIAAVWWLCALAWVALIPIRVTRTAAGLAGILVLVPAWVALMRMRLDWPRGAEWTLFLLLVIWAADTGAYLAGRSFGRHKLAPRVSPGKTWEGVAGGLALAALVGVAGAAWLDMPMHALVVLCVVTAAFSVVGDLTESMLKRYAGLKDSGRLIPGHGGMMDRIDSITAGAPILMLGLILMELA